MTIPFRPHHRHGTRAQALFRYTMPCENPDDPVKKTTPLPRRQVAERALATGIATTRNGSSSGKLRRKRGRATL
jgi:hypothetical protein